MDRTQGEDAKVWHDCGVLREVQEAYLKLPSVKRRIAMYGKDCKLRWTLGPCPTFADCERPLPAWDGFMRDAIARERP